MRIALLMNLAPRKLGSLEDWALAFGAEALGRGHEVDFFGSSPVHEVFATRLKQLGVGWNDLESLKRSPTRAIRRLANYHLINLTLFSALERCSLLAYAAAPARVILIDQVSGPIPGRPSPRNWRGAIPRQLAYRLIGHRIDGVCAVTDYVRERERRRFALPDRKAKTIYHGVDVGRFQARRPRGTSSSGARIICVAYLIPEKGVEYLVRAFAQMRDRTSRLTIVGDGPQASMLGELAVRSNVGDRVSFLGLRDDVEDLIDQSDIFVHPAIWAEAFGFTIAEAIASERAVIASRVGGIPELIEHGRSGILVEPGDVSALTAALDRLTEDASFRLELGQNARRRAVDKFDLKRSVRGHLDWYESLVLGRAGDARPLSAIHE